MTVVLVFMALFLAGAAAGSLCRKTGNRFEALAMSITTSGAAGFFHLVLPWFRLGQWPRIITITLLLVASGANALAAVRFTERRLTPSLVGTGGMGAFLLLAFVWALAAPLPPGLEVAFPLEGTGWYVTHGGPTILTNYHVVSAEQRYAVDLVRVGSGGRSHGGDPALVASYHAWDAMVLAPVKGTVVTAVDRLPDQAPGSGDRARPAGNHVILETEEGVRLVLAHLRAGSVVVSPGQVVAAGTLLGRVGNSGHSSEPHLHLHAMRRENEGWVGVSLRFGSRIPRRGTVLP